MAILSRLTRRKPHYSPESISNVFVGAVIAYGVWVMIKEKLDAREHERGNEFTRSLNLIREMVKKHYLNDQWLAANAKTSLGEISANRIAERIYRPGKADDDILGCFKEGVANLGKFLKAVETHLEPAAKLIADEDQRLCKLADSLTIDNEAHCERLDVEMKKSIDKMKRLRPPVAELRAPAKWYLNGLSLDGTDVYFEEIKPTHFPKTVRRLTSTQIKEVANTLIQALDMLDRYEKLHARNFTVANDDGEKFRHFYDNTHYMSEYYDITEDDAWNVVVIDQPFKGMVDACQGMMYYMEQSLK